MAQPGFEKMADSGIGVASRDTAWHWLACAGALAVLGGCGGGGASPEIAGEMPPDARAVDQRLAELAYSPDERTPPGFYSEPERYSDRSVFRFHVKSDDVGVPAQVAFEVCTNDFAQALSWSASGAEARDFETELAGNDETVWFYEFDRMVSGTEPAVVINRVFKCSALDRQGAVPDGFAGQLTMRPLGSDELRFVAEYMWQFSRFNNALNAVYDSVPGSEAGALTHTLRRVQVQQGAGAVAGCDRIEVWHWRWRADPLDGSLSSEQHFERAFDARRENGAVRLCGG